MENIAIKHWQIERDREKEKKKRKKRERDTH